MDNYASCISRRLTIIVLDLLVAFTKNVVHVDELRVARISHTMIANEDDVDDICEIPCLQRIMDIHSESVDLLEDALIPTAVSVLQPGDCEGTHIDERRNRACQVACLVKRRIICWQQVG